MENYNYFCTYNKVYKGLYEYFTFTRVLKERKYGKT